MYCEQFEQRLNEQLDRRALPHDDAALRAHAQQCAGCAALLASYATLLHGVEQLPTPQLSASLAERMTAELQKLAPAATEAAVLHLPATRRRRRVSMVAAMAALAAALLLTVPLLWMLRLRDEGQMPEGAVARTAEHIEQQASPARDAPSAADGAPSPARRPIRTWANGLAQETRRSFSGAMLIVPGVGPRPADAEAAAEPVAEVVETRPGDSESVMKNFSPVTESTASALDSLLKILPAGDEDPQS